MQKILLAHGLGRRAQRVPRAPAVAAATTGLITQPAAADELFGFLPLGAPPRGPGAWTATSRAWATAVDTATRWAVAMTVLGVRNGATTARYLDHIGRRFARQGVIVRAVLTDNGPEYLARAFTTAVAA